MGRYQILFYPERCAGCRRCELACSRRYTGRFNPEAAFLKVFLDETENGTEAAVTFSEQCDHCGLCAEACLYEALVRTGQEAA
ncbi:MAG: 4Fe-4S dicluster domain-containing protein [Desulfosudaceae bacterium]